VRDSFNLDYVGAFTLAVTRDMGTKRGKAYGSFVAESMRQTLGFYGDVLQKVNKWTPPTPKLKKSQDEQPSPVATNEVAKLDARSLTADEVDSSATVIETDPLKSRDFR
jgi:hypothetical protein